MSDSSGHPTAASPLLDTKLYIPQRRSTAVPRPRLIERLDEGTERNLTLVSAPAGFGKTTLLAEWLGGPAASKRPAAWLSLDRGDNNLELFWAYVITALQGVRPELGENTLSSLRSSQSPPNEWVVTTLINDITAIDGEFSTGSGSKLTLILDDYHVIEAEPVHRSVTFLLEHLPPQMHLVVATRSDPPLPLARLRARGELTELRAADLRFAPDEAAAFLNEVMGLDLASADVAALERRTEGWIAGLQLAALSMQGRADVPRLVRAFAGDDRYVVDYLVEEVLRRQPDHIRGFLLQTSILDRLSGPLCDAVTGREDGQQLLTTLERGNLFVVPLDDKRRWFRYHHLFADALRVHVAEEQPTGMPVLHRRASAWCERNGQPSEAVQHALAGEDFGRAAGLVELAGRAMLIGQQDAVFLGWLKMLPDELVRTRPVLCVYYALALVSFDPEAAEGRLRDVERLVDMAVQGSEWPAGAAGEMVVHDDEGFGSLRGMIAIVRAYRAGALGDVPGIVYYARQAWQLLPEDDHLWRGAAGGLLGLAHWTSGDLEAAYRALADAWASLRMTGDSQEVSSAFVLADIRVAQGRLSEAARLYEQALHRAAGTGGSIPPPAADLYVGLGELSCEHGDLEGASRYLQRSKELSEHGGIAEHRHRWFVAMARIEEARGDLDGALDLLDEAERVYVSSPAPDVRPIAALKTRVWVRQGRLAEALGWARERGLSVDEHLSYLREFEHITLARVLIASHKRHQEEGPLRDAMALLERLRDTAEAGERTGSLIEILTVQALAHEAQADVAGALAPLERALTLAQPERYVRTFVGEGQTMRTLLRHAAAGGIASAYTQRLLAAIDESAQPVSTAAQVAPGLAEPLTGREVEILRLIATGMRNQEIANHLFISLSTVKRHIANAYRKLDVSHRTQAVARINELNLL
ncbi:LuxR C-terminal-related transcriptional regulator [Ornithinimicrobium cryptoxanthini]|uniref:LuxR C-terminal-related transcriptional regulator n=1 Tax=Ornithinimicrobium cryptoxanthini TaxID=2934161 RepID=UPI0024766163|nr:LuxR C-terminal-related transcriptional regulator [Ornithinimicrobium cryptoxanthini]